MGKNDQWWQDELFWKATYPYIFSEERQRKTKQEVEFIEQKLRLAGNEKILDAPCGAGRHSLLLAERGYDVTGIDYSDFLLSRAKELAEERSLDVEFKQMNILEFSQPEAFDVALNLFTSYGYFENENKNYQVLKNIYQTLKPGGNFVLNIKSKECFAMALGKKNNPDKLDQDGWREHYQPFNNWRRMKITYKFPYQGEMQEHTATLWIYSAREMTAILRGIGFQIQAIFGGFKEQPFDENATELVIIASKNQ